MKEQKIETIQRCKDARMQEFHKGKMGKNVNILKTMTHCIHGKKCTAD